MDKNISLPLLVRGKGLKPSHEMTSTIKTFSQMCNKRITHVQLIIFLKEKHYLDAC
jgi:hypothetical protein